MPFLTISPPPGALLPWFFNSAASHGPGELSFF